MDHMKKIGSLLLCVIMLCTFFTGCSYENKTNTPQDVIENTYGNQEFQISFMSEGLSAPLDSITYTANSIPKLPTPKKIGYIFSGWYLDEKLTIPYMDGILYLYMQDVTLYPKWEKESFETNGTYDVEYTAKILEDSIVKGSKTDEYGGYMDFTKSLIENEICLEKSENKLLLKLVFDTERTIPMMTSAGSVYTVKVSSKMDSSITVAEKIDSLADTQKTVFVDVTNFDLEDTLYLDVTTVNWWTDDLEDGDRIDTQTRYTVAIDLTNIIGFSGSYVDTSVPLEKGYYLVKSYYTQKDNTSTMTESFNPVYAYIYSDGEEHYTLIKQNIPYAGLASNSGVTIENSADNYYNRLMSLIPTQLFYEISDPPKGNDEVISNYYPETYGGKYYGNYAMEYHADTGKFYNIYDLGNNLKSSYMTMTAVTGFMEAATAMGYNNLILRIDYEHMLKIAETDYTPLTGDSYTYQSKMQYYPGNVNDLSDRDMCYDIMKDGGLSTDLVNFFFTAPSLDFSTQNRTQLSSRVEITPSAGTNSTTVAESRYRMAYFDINTQVFDYDPKTDETLYADVMGVNSMGSLGMRYNKTIKVGKSVNVGDTIHLSDIYAEKCNKTADFSTVSWSVYGMKNGKIDYNDKRSFANSAFTFEDNVAVCFEQKTENGTQLSIVELVKYEDPNINIENNSKYPYDPSASYSVGDEISFPYVRYSWLGKNDVFIDEYYPGASSFEAEYSINILRTAVYKIVNDNYVWVKEAVARNKTTFEVPSEKFVVVYELTNPYGERYYYTVNFVCNSRLEYTVVDDKENVIDNGGVQYNDEGERYSISVYRTSFRLTNDNYMDLLDTNYVLRISGFDRPFTLAEYTLYTDTLSEVSAKADPNTKIMAESLWKMINGSKYAVLKLVYECGNDSVIATYYYNVNFSGKISTELLTQSDYFAGYTYSFILPSVYDSEGNSIATADVFTHDSYCTLIRDKQQYKLTFKQAGSYEILQNYSIGELRLSFSQQIYVWSNNVDVNITYITDAKHPFSDGTLKKTVTYNLADYIYTMNRSGFDESIPKSDVLYGWAIKENSFACQVRSGNIIEDFVSDYGSRSITLYAIWDTGLTLTIDKGDGTTYEKTYYINNYGWYSISIEDFVAAVPDGYQNVGWSCDLWKGIAVRSVSLSPSKVNFDDLDSMKVTPNFKKEFTVKYIVDSSLSNAFFRNEIVLDGETIASVANKLDVSSKLDGYAFVGWYIYGDTTETLVDIETYVITENISFVAKFLPLTEV